MNWPMVKSRKLRTVSERKVSWRHRVKDPELNVAAYCVDAVGRSRFQLPFSLQER
jgi:hypothetical protein